MEEVIQVPWEQWLALLRHIAYQLVLAWLGKEPVPLQFRFEVGGKVALVLGEVRVIDPALPEHEQGSEHVQQAVTDGATAAHNAVTEGVANAIVRQQGEDAAAAAGNEKPKADEKGKAK